MEFFPWITISIIIIGFVVLGLIKRNLERKKSASTQSLIWLIVGTTAWGLVSIMLVIWSFGNY